MPLTKQSKSEAKVLRSKSKGTKSSCSDQPKITEAMEPTNPDQKGPDSQAASGSSATPATPAIAAPATAADIATILKKLESIQKDNTVIRTTLSEIKSSFQAKIDAVDAKVSTLSVETKSAIAEHSENIKSINSTVKGIEESMNFQDKQLLEQKKEFMKLIEEREKKINQKLQDLERNDLELNKKLKTMQEDKIDLERNIRKYNLLLHGIPEMTGENIYRTVKTFLKKDVKLPEETVDQFIFQNAHRIPFRGSGPRPIIVRFVRWSDREAVLNRVFSGVLPKGKNILTDLPPALKAERYRLSQEAYKLRKGPDKLKTRVLEKGNKLKLQSRKDKSDPWQDVDV